MRGTNSEEDAALLLYKTLWTRFDLEDQTVLDGAPQPTLRPRLEDRSAEFEGLPLLWGALPDDDNDSEGELAPSEPIGEGGMAVVYGALQRSVGREVAVKRLRPALQGSHSAAASLLGEGRIMGILEHPNIIPVYMLGRDAQAKPLIVMKRVEGVSWAALLKDPTKAPQGFGSQAPLEMHLEILLQVCLAVHFAHARGVLHRDLKPSNVMLGAHGEVYVLDWGLAVALDDKAPDWLPKAQAVSAPAGTPAYMAPEQAEGDGKALGVWTDVYLLGAILHEILTGAAPHRGGTVFQMLFHAAQSQPQPYPSEAPGALAQIARRAMHRDPGQRFESAAALRQALVEARQHQSSAQLAQESEQRLSELEGLLAQGDRVGIYRVFGACRFGFEQALRVWPQNGAAGDGLQRALRALADWELTQGSFEAAAVLIADLKGSNPALEARLEARLEALSRDLLIRREQAAAFHELKQQRNSEVGRSSRSQLSIILGVSMSAMLSLIEINKHSTFMDFNYTLYTIHWLSFALAVGLGTWIWRRRLLQNQVNRQISISLTIIVIAVLAHRLGCWRGNVALEVAFSQEMLLYGGSCALMAVTTDLRIFLASGPYFVAGVLGFLWPEHVYWICAIGNGLAMGLLAWAWRDCGVGPERHVA